MEERGKMNRTNSNYLIPAVIVPALALFMAVAVPSTGYAGDGAKARVIATEGQVQIKPAGSSEWQTGSRGAWLAEGSEVSSGELSSCIIGLGEGSSSAVTLNENSKVVLASLDPIKLNLDSGNLIGIVKGLQQGSTFEVMTSTAVASVRGTKFYVSADGVIAVLEGQLEVTYPDGTKVTVNAGEQLNVASQEIGEISAELSQEIQDSADAVQEISEGTQTVQGDGGSRPNTQVGPPTP
jgi:hypothetical protein